jgi:hypothetical protein
MLALAPVHNTTITIEKNQQIMIENIKNTPEMG